MYCKLSNVRLYSTLGRKNLWIIELILLSLLVDSCDCSTIRFSDSNLKFMDNLPSNATPSILGIIHQFYIALEKCFSLVEGERVYIERYGDVTVSNNCQIEVKKYEDVLTNTHRNIWKTLKNWLHEDFKPAFYNSLILLTTQEFGSQSSFSGWNELDVDKKYTILSQVFDNYSKLSKKDDTTESLLSIVMSDANRDKLLSILERFTIITSNISGVDLFTKLRDQHSKGVIPEFRDDFINALLGYIINPTMSNNSGWEISYKNFSEKVMEFTDMYRSKTIIFPQIDNTTYNEADYSEHPFVTKIKDINHNEEIPYAISDYARTNMLIIGDLKKHRIPQSVYTAYNGELKYMHSRKYRAAKVSCSQENIIPASQQFYISVMEQPVLKFANFDPTPEFFRNGLIHSLINNDENNLKWKLSDE